jgi:hypothetical protein
MDGNQPVLGLPTELTDAIIDHLHDDKPTLLNCSLVCRSWLDASRYHLFYSLRVRGEHPEMGFAAFLAFIDTTAHIRKYIQEVCLRGVGGLAARPPEGRRVGPYIFAFLLRTLPTLQSIILENVSWDKSLTASPEGYAVELWPLTPSKALQTLTFVRVVTEEMLSLRVFRLNDILQILSSLQSLRALNLLGLTLELNSQASMRPTFPENLKLEVMNIQSNYSRLQDATALDAMHETMAKHLRKLSVACRNDEEALIVGNILRTIGPTLEELRLDHSDMTALRAFSKYHRTTRFPLEL